MVIGHDEREDPTVEEILCHASELAAEDHEPEERRLPHDARNRVIKQVLAGKIVLGTYQGDLKLPHFGLIGDSLFIQQTHQHNQPSSLVFLDCADEDALTWTSCLMTELIDTAAAQFGRA